MGDQVVQKVGLIDDDEKEERTNDGAKYFSLVWILFVPLRSEQDCTCGKWEMK